MNRRTAFVRSLRFAAAVAVGAMLAGCQTEGISPATMVRALKPLPPELVAELERKNMPKDSPILIRIFKEEAELEVWKQDSEGKYAHLKTYPICRWSGELGPKVRQGDRQAPEGFYAISPGQMNPHSNYYLAFNLGFPNAFDKANGRNGDFLMVHGDCSSAGCYAMTDEQISDIYALGRDAFLGGQKSFQVQAYPFHMTPLNMAKHRNSPHMAFWRMIKEGNDIFETSRKEPRIDVCDRHYVFNAVTQGGGGFSPVAKCPAYQTDPEIASIFRQKQNKDEQEFASYASRGIATAPVTTGADGGMHPVFVAKLRSQTPGATDSDGRFVSMAAVKAPGTIPAHVNPPKNFDELSGTVTAVAYSEQPKSAEPAKPATASGSLYATASSGSRPAPAPRGAATPASGAQAAPGVQVATAEPPQSSSFFGGLFSSLGEKPAAAPAAAPEPIAKLRGTNTTPALIAKHTAAPPRVVAIAMPQGKSDATKTEANKSGAQQAATVAASTPAAQPGTATGGMMAGAQPVVSSGGFDSRWGAFK